MNDIIILRTLLFSFAIILVGLESGNYFGILDDKFISSNYTLDSVYFLFIGKAIISDLYCVSLKKVIYLCMLYYILHIFSNINIYKYYLILT